MTTIRINIQSAFFLALKTIEATLLLAVLASIVNFAIVKVASAQQAAPQAIPLTQAAPAAGLAPAVAIEGDSIDMRAKRAAELEEARAKAEQFKLNPALATVNSPQPKVMKVVVPRPEFYVEAIRGFDGSLEAALVIGGKRVTGSKSYPSLTDGWVISAITDHGVTITNVKGKTRQTQSLAFVGPEPYMPTSETAQAAGLSVGMPSVGRPIAIGVLGR